MSKLEGESVGYRNNLIAKNMFNYNDEYTVGNKDEKSPIGKDTNASGDIGSAADIKQRQLLTTKNEYNYNDEYNAGND